ncbi:PAS domain S-box protein [Iningainema sp. BLCCT55]|uniref:histidine kinase n=2 Tax=Iningainema TaxID=1932705 RepID=A0A8J7C9L2_9CYAN|nr:PAS domain-containing sensor histidine kinase [Iningainema tapete]MBD2776071.1 PAS domain S-box protein [Iningainema tapete BLCC-T55]
MIFQFLQRQDGSHSLLYASSGSRELYELEPEVVQRDFSEGIYKFIHPQDRKSFEESVATSYHTLGPWHWEGRIITPSGKLKWIQGSSRPEQQANGDIIWDGFVWDITVRKQAEEQQRCLAEKFSKAFRCSPNAITISTLHEGRIIEVNNSFVKLSGYEREEVIGRSVLELNIWVNKSDRAVMLQQLLSTKAVHNLEFEFRKKSGEIRIGLFSAEIIHLNSVPCLLAVSHDITERKHTEELVRLSAKRDRLLAETLTRIRSSLNLDQILQTTVNEVRQFLQADRVFIAVSDAEVKSKIIAESVVTQYPSVLGWQADDDLLNEWKKQFANSRVRIINDITQTAESPKIIALYQQFQIKASLAVPIVLNAELFGALIANCSSPRHWHSMEIDLLQRMSEQLAIAIQQAQLYQQLAQLNSNLERQVEERTAQLQQKMQELQELNRVKDVVLHTVSHDLRTSVMGNLMVLNNLLNKQVGSPPPLISIPRSIIERMIQGNDRQLAMIDSLLEIHSSEEQGIVLNCEIVNLSALLAKIIQDLQPVFRQHQVTVKNLISSDLPLVIADPALLRKVFINLFTHGWQKNPPGLNFTLKATVETGKIRIYIQNNGVGMSKQECDRLFDLYIREPQATCSTDIGLKMFLSRQIIQAHNGEIGVFSDRKRGLTFWLTLPIATQLS